MDKLLIIYFLFFSICCYSQTPPWQNPEVVNVNKMPARATSISFPTENLAIAFDRDASPRKKMLNGQWKFSLHEAPAKVPEEFYTTTFSDKGWKEIPVPSNWELEGYGKPWHRLTHQIWEKKGVRQPNIPTDYNPTGLYRKKIDIPKLWKDMQITLHVGAASSSLSVWVNGNYVGYSEDNMLPAEFDITQYLKEKNNLIAFQVSQWSDGSYLEDQDHWRMSGITRDVFLEAAPKVQIYDFAVRTDLDSDYKDAELQIRPEVMIYDNTDIKGWNVEAELYDSKKKKVFDSTLVVSVERIINEHYPQIGNRPFQNLMKILVKKPKKWSAEYPNLYTLVLSLKNDKGELVEARSTRIGFREIDISDGQFKVNGVPVLLYGVNRHDWDSKTAKAVTKAAMRRDAELMKQLNVNASRSSHYPNPPYWYELCDEYGIYVMDEANIESHGHGSLFSNIPAWHTTFLERGIRMVERDKNYPSIMSWSLGNEAGFGPNHAALSAWIKEFDPTRPIHAEGAQNIYGYNWPSPEPKDRIYTDFVSRMYRPTELMIDLATKADDDRPVIWCEYAHSQGNSTGDMETYWKAIRKYPRFVGAYVWDWRDQLIEKQSEDGKPLWAHGTDFDQLQADLNPVQKGLITADGKIKSGGWQARKVWQRVEFNALDINEGVFELSNRHFRTNLNEYNLTWQITQDGLPMQSGSGVSPNVEPGTNGRVSLNLPELEPRAGVRYHLKIALTLKEDQLWAKKGFEVASEQFLWKYAPLENMQLPTGQVTLKNEGNKISLEVNEFVLTLDKQTGLISEFSRSDKNVIGVPPTPNFWRPPTDNDYASRIEKRQGVWKAASTEPPVLLSIKSGQGKDESKIITLHKLAGIEAQIKQTYLLKPDGSLEVKYDFIPGANLPNLPKLGWQLQIPQQYDEMVWFGRGPYESYADKKTGMEFGRYTASVKNDFTYYVRPQESSNKADVYWLELRDKKGTGIRVESKSRPLSMSAWPFTPDQLENSNRIEELTFSEMITLNVDLKQMGVGGDNTWNIDAAPHEPFRVISKPYSYSFIVKWIDN